MSTIDDRTMSTGFTRRSAIRGAAWTTAAVTVVVATPNIAAASGGSGAPGVTLTPGVPNKYSVKDTKYVAWDIDVRANDIDLTSLQIQLTYNQTGGGGTSTLSSVLVESFDPAAGGTWTSTVTKPTMTATATAVLNGTVTGGTTLPLHVQFEGTDNSSGQVSAILLANNSANEQVVIGAIPMTTWVSDSEHSH